MRSQYAIGTLLVSLILYRDINPNNVMVNGDFVTLIDFNVAKRFRDPESGLKLLMLTNTGAAAFSAPEISSNSAYK